jgi:hypothetical protein
MQGPPSGGSFFAFLSAFESHILNVTTLIVYFLLKDKHMKKDVILAELNEMFKDRDLEIDVQNIMMHGLTVQQLKDFLSGKTPMTDLDVYMIMSAVIEVKDAQSDNPTVKLDPKYQKHFQALKPLLRPGNVLAADLEAISTSFIFKH